VIDAERGDGNRQRDRRPVRRQHAGDPDRGDRERRRADDEREFRRRIPAGARPEVRLADRRAELDDERQERAGDGDEAARRVIAVAVQLPRYVT
jgi:hypothetical protein